MDRPTRYKQDALGLIASSWHLWQHALEQGHAWTLILEDDCELAPCLADAD
jgi:hypothetical protein